MALLKKIDNNKSCQESQKKKNRTIYISGKNGKCHRCLKGLEDPQMVRYRVSKYSSSFPPGGRGGRNENVRESLTMNIHSNIIPTNPKWKKPTGA